MIFHPSTKKMSRYLDGELPEKAARRFEAHLAKCEVCGRKMKMLQAMGKVCRLPARRLDAISENVMSRVGQTVSGADRVGQTAGLPEGTTPIQNTSPILAEIQSVAGTVLIRNAAKLKPIEAFPGCALQRGDWLHPAPGASAVIRWENGALLQITEEINVNLLATAPAAVAKQPQRPPLRSVFNLQVVGQIWNKLKFEHRTFNLLAFLKQCDRTSLFLGAATAVAVFGIVVMAVLNPDRQGYVANQKKAPVIVAKSDGKGYTYVGTTAGTLTTDEAMRARSGNLAYTYDPTNGAIVMGDVYRVGDGGDSPQGFDQAAQTANLKKTPTIQAGGTYAGSLVVGEGEMNGHPDVMDQTDLRWSYVETGVNPWQRSSPQASPVEAPTGYVGKGGVGLILGPYYSPSSPNGATPPSSPPTPKATPAPKTAANETQPAPEESKTVEKRLVIYTAQFSILVGSVEDAMKDLAKKIEDWKGYVQTTDLRRVTFRVPAASFDRAVEEISRLGVVTAKQVQSQDVTRQFMDVQLRIEVAEASRKRLMALLEKADTTEALLKIENEIRRLTEEIERMKGDLRTLGDQIVYSTITVDFSAKAPEAKPAASRRGGLSYFAWINQIGVENVLRAF